MAEKIDRYPCSQEVVNYYKQFENKNLKLKQTTLHGTNFTLDERYKLIDKIGQGAYGTVVAGLDQKEKDKAKRAVAVKKIEKAFEHRIYTKRTLRELKLQRLLQHDNILGVKNLQLPQGRQQLEDIYVSSELLETDLQQIIKHQNELTPDMIKFFLYQILRGLKFIHSAGVIHRDMKPRNLLINSNWDLKICDFGLARAVDNESNKKADNLTDYVITRWYRPPELLLSATDYTSAVDIWSVGVIFAEMMKRKTFLPGQSTTDQFIKILEVIGTPTEEQLKLVQHEDDRKFIRNLVHKEPKPLDKLFPQAQYEALDLLSKMLQFDYNKRITAEQALNHPFLADVHLPEDEPNSSQLPMMEFEFENYPNLTKQQYKDLVYEEILLYHYPEFRKEYEQNVKNGKSICQHIINNDNKNVVDPEDFDDDN